MVNSLLIHHYLVYVIIQRQNHHVLYIYIITEVRFMTVDSQEDSPSTVILDMYHTDVLLASLIL